MGAGTGRPGPRGWRRRTRWWAAASALAAATLVAAVLEGPALVIGAGQRPGGASTAPTTPGPAATGPGSLGLGRAAPSIARPPTATAVRALLRERGRAVTERDAAGWSSTLDPADPGLAAAQRALYDRLARLPLSRWAYAPWPGAGEGSVDPVAGTRTLRVRLSYSIAGFDAGPVLREQIVTAVSGADGRALVSATAPVGVLDIWDLGPVEVREGPGTLVLARRGVTPAPLTTAALEAEAGLAVARVAAAWPAPWPRRVVVVLPADEGEMARVLGRGAGGLEQLAAVTTGAPGRAGAPTTGDRVVVNPRAYAGLGATARRVVLTHETVHVATRAAGGQPVPLWLSEGFADEVALTAEGVGHDLAARPLLDAVRSGDVPGDLPGDAAFDASAGPLGTAYEQAWTACRLIADVHGRGALVGFYRAVQQVGERRAFADALSVTRAGFVAQWRTALVRAAGPVPVDG